MEYTLEEQIKDLETDILDDEKNLINEQEALAIALSHLNTSISVLREDKEKLIELLKSNLK